MIIDVTLKITPKILKKAFKNEKMTFNGHIGTHFDVMNKKFPLKYSERIGIIFDVTNVENEITSKDIDLTIVKKDMFVIFYTGFIEKVKYGSEEYFKKHPELSTELIQKLIDLKISIIGIDFAGVKRGEYHTPMDQYCADYNVFIVENLCNLKNVLKYDKDFKVCTYPMNYTNMTGLPCRVLIRI